MNFAMLAKYYIGSGCENEWNE